MRRIAEPLPFEHVVVDVEAETGQHNVLVVANETVVGHELLDKVRERNAQGNVSFLIICPQGDAHGSYDQAERRLRRVLGELRGEGVDVHGQVSHPDPYTAAMETINDERVDEIIVSTFPETRSGWLRRDLIERLRKDSGLPVEHVVSDVPSEV